MAIAGAYAVFISYARADAAHAQWLSRFLESLWIADPRPRRPFKRVFRDVDEMGAAQELGAALRDKLDQSDRLIILASATSLKSQWVAEEIRYFRSHHPSRPVFTIVVGEPGLRGQSLRAWATSILGADAAQQHPLLVNAEPASPDMEAEGRLVAARRLAAGMLDVSYDTLAGRRARASMMLGGAAALVVGMVGAIAFFGQPALTSWRAMEAQRAAESSFIAELAGKAEDQNEAANLFACCADLVARAPADVRTRLEQTVRASGALSGPMRIEQRSLAGYNSIAAMDAERFVASGGSGFRVIGPDGADVVSGDGNVAGIGWDLPSNRLFVVSAGFNFRGANVRSVALSGSHSGAPIIPHGASFDLSASSVRILAVSGAYAYFIDESTWRVLQLDMRNGAAVAGNAGRPTRATASPDGRIVLLGGGDPNDTLLVDMATSRSLANVRGTLTDFGLIADDRVFRFDTWSWVPIVDRGQGALRGYDGLIVENHTSVADFPNRTIGIAQVRCSSETTACEKTTVLSTPYVADGQTSTLSDDAHLASTFNGVYDLASGARLFQNGEQHLFARNDSRSVLGLDSSSELVRWDLDQSATLPTDQFQQRLCSTERRFEAVTVGTRSYSCERR